LYVITRSDISSRTKQDWPRCAQYALQMARAPTPNRRDEGVSRTYRRLCGGPLLQRIEHKDLDARLAPLESAFFR
jgi:hypothetical protein